MPTTDDKILVNTTTHGIHDLEISPNDPNNKRQGRSMTIHNATAHSLKIIIYRQI